MGQFSVVFDLNSIVHSSEKDNRLKGYETSVICMSLVFTGKVITQKNKIRLTPM
jgi:hypothetical protein